ncbi:MAG: glycoside hydrolase family 38 C-terminal domain-containing protein, partial [Clostridia bacterium]
MQNIHLICNAHLDPVWLWEIEEGIAETLSTFRTAADFCEEFPGFVFNHNEAILYQWIEEHDPDLFHRIQKLVGEGKWYIMGGWFLQPDCNMPSGESFVRQILAGTTYFLEKFGVEPRVVINFDAFGHTRGLVEICKGAGYEGMVFCRPEPDMLELPGEDFRWVGYQGNSLMCHRAYNSYESHRGEADEKIKGWMRDNPSTHPGLVLWGIGNHGGGPSKVDFLKINELAAKQENASLLHSSPEAYFQELAASKRKLPEYAGILNPRYIGCYTTQIRIKQLHRKLENELFMTEKMLAHASLEGYFPYPGKQVKKALQDLLTLQFHDILPGSSIPEVEEYSLALAGHGLEEMRRLKAKAFFALCQGQEKAEEGIIPVFAYNPHPYPVEKILACEFQLPDQNKNREIFAYPVVSKDGEELPCQVEHEASNFNVDWRKKSVFYARLEPGSINRFDVSIRMVREKPDASMRQEGHHLVFQTAELEVIINTLTGLMDKYRVNGVDYLRENAFAPLVMMDDENSWSHKERGFRNQEGVFCLMDEEKGSRFSGIREGFIPSVRVIEDGPVRTVVESVLAYDTSRICQRYFLPKKGTEVEVGTRVFWNEKMRMLKLSLPTCLENAKFFGQTAYGSEELLTNGEEMVSQKWNLLSDGTHALSLINTCTYGSDAKDGELRVSLLRSPG